jgi:hypothetical protein
LTTALLWPPFGRLRLQVAFTAGSVMGFVVVVAVGLGCLATVPSRLARITTPLRSAGLREVAAEPSGASPDLGAAYGYASWPRALPAPCEAFHILREAATAAGAGDAEATRLDASERRG